jgi:hypothetical protein
MHCNDSQMAESTLLRFRTISMSKLLKMRELDFSSKNSRILRVSRIFETWKIPNKFIVLQIPLNGSNGSIPHDVIQ